MNFFGIGPLEATLVIVVAVIVLGPERIPEVAVQIARAVKFLRGYATSATSQMRAELDELTREYEEVRRELKEFRDSVGKDVKSMTDQVGKTLLDEPALKAPIIEPGGEPPPSRETVEPPAKSPTDGA
jgi:sec-independent protein translocase protein TatB